jgi:ssDNA-binding Zn-finger/Zn-ribbon topoisomerase 1
MRQHFRTDDDALMDLVLGLLEREFERMSPLCPTCELKMVKCHNSKTGRPFWGCRDFPNCNDSRFLRKARRRDRVEAALAFIKNVIHSGNRADGGPEKQ